ELPIRVPFLNINADGSADATSTLIVNWSNVEDPSTLSVQLPTSLQVVLPDFTHMDAGTFVSLLGQISGWLEQFRHSFNAADLPLVGPALDEVLQFADLFHDTLLFDDLDDADPNTGVDKLLNKDDQPTFTTVQDMVGRLVTIFGAGDIVHYNQAAE